MTKDTGTFNNDGESQNRWQKSATKQNLRKQLEAIPFHLLYQTYEYTGNAHLYILAAFRIRTVKDFHRTYFIYLSGE